MKRTPLARKTPLARGSKPMARSRMFADGFWYSLYPGGRRVDGQAVDENAARQAAIEALRR